MHALARELAGSFTRDAERARALERALRERGRYTDTPPPLGAEDERSPIEDFLLGELAGHCEYFASALVVLARSLGLPARLVNGFAGGRENGLGGFVEVTRADAHAWVEIHYEKAGWVRYDATPPDLRLRAAAARSAGEILAQLGSALELWWFQRVVDFDTSDQIAALKSAWGVFRGWRDESEGETLRADTGEKSPWRADLAPSPRTLGLGAIAVLLALLLLRRRGGAERGDALPHSYARALRLLARRGLERGDSTTARAFAREAASTLDPDSGLAFDRLTETYLAERFGGQSEPGAAESDLATLRRALRRRPVRECEEIGRGACS